MKRAEAESARVKAEFAEKEALLHKQQASLVEEQDRTLAHSKRVKAELEANLNLLNQQKEAAAAEAELRVLETVEEEATTSRSNDSDIHMPQGTEEHVHRYLLEQASLVNNEAPPLNACSGQQGHGELGFPPGWNNSSPQNPDQDPPCTKVATDLRVDAPVFHPVDHHNQALPTPPVQKTEDNMTSEFTRFLLKKDLLLSRLVPFDDKPETFMVWKASFRNIMCELGVTAFEELDLLVKWLGPESSRHAKSIRASNATNPSRGLQRVWERLDERFGSPEMIEAALKSKLDKFPKLTTKDTKRIYELADILSEIESTKEDVKYHTLLSYYDSSSGVLPIVNKLPHNIQEKWTSKAVSYKKQHGVSFPPFSFFAEFIREIARIKNDPGFTYESSTNIPLRKSFNPTNRFISAKKTDVQKQTTVVDVGAHRQCPLHKTKHSLNHCRGFRTKPLEERKRLLKEYGVCFRCCDAMDHKQKSCKKVLKCDECSSNHHPSALHVSSRPTDGGEKGPADGDASISRVFTKCTSICGDKFQGKSCAKTILVKVYRAGHPEDAVKMYAILDDQSNHTLAKPDFFDLLNLPNDTMEYMLSSCAGRVTTVGRKASDCIVETWDGSCAFELPTVIECHQIPNVREEIPTPEVAKHFPHLADICSYIPPLDPDAQILLLVGRDLPEAHHVHEQKIGPRHSPYAQHLGLGWAIIGETCLGKLHKPDLINVCKTHLLPDGRESVFEPCPYDFSVKEIHADPFRDDPVFMLTKEDNKVGMSVEDREFLTLMDAEFKRDVNGNWMAPLPFRKARPKLPNNRSQALKRARILDSSLKKDSVKKEHFIQFMNKIFENGHAEIAPPLMLEEECWYLPIFGVYHPKKKNQLRAVFDSSARYDGLSLNDVLLTGPDLTNSLLGVLIRFRQERVAVMADIQQMFYCFLVDEQHRNYLRFLWYRDNDLNQEMVDYRMRVHVFGNSPSPAVATYGLRKTAAVSEAEFGVDVRKFVERNFYVDDGLTSFPTADQAIDLLRRTQRALSVGGKLRLHKITSNCKEVLNAFPSEDLAQDLRDIDLGVDDMPSQRSLGVTWSLDTDTFTFQVSSERKPYTRRGVLSVINSIFDPMGFVAPVTIKGKLLLRTLMLEVSGWDEPLPPAFQSQWEEWKESLHHLSKIHVPRVYSVVSPLVASGKEILVFSDASEKAIAAVAYLRTFTGADYQLGFILGKAKVAPSHCHSIPRLELCAAVLAVEVSEVVLESLEFTPDAVRFYTDSRVVLGYIHNSKRRFYVYVSNRVQRIRRSTNPEQWHYIPTNLNPADCATRSVPASQLGSSPWLMGPSRLPSSASPAELEFPLVDPDNDKNLRQEVTVLKTEVGQSERLGSHRFSRFSSWKILVETFARLRHIAASFSSRIKMCKRWHLCPEARTGKTFHQTEMFLVRTVQEECYGDEIECLRKGEPLPRNSRILSLDPFLDQEGMLCVGGRVKKASIPSKEKNPYIIPKGHHIAILLIRHHHEAVRHQGRLLTEGAIRSAGLWLVGGKRLISSEIRKCFQCKKLRGRQQFQKMAELPSDRLEPTPPFTNVGVDVFGPWLIVSRRTRGGAASSKRWAVLFTCLTTRAIHIEVVEEMSSSSFINALRRLIAVRGPLKILRSDRGTNFIGACDDLVVNAIMVEDGPVGKHLYNQGITWIFNPPHSSHMGGVWERMIGITRRILDDMLSGVARGHLTHEILVTLMAEVSAIVNARPIVSVSSDPEQPEVLSPSLLLTQKGVAVEGSQQPCDTQDLYKNQWKRVRLLAEMFWKRWRSEYLQTLQSRQKWCQDQPNVKEGDVILLREKEVHRNDWPIGLIDKAIPSDDGKVRKVVVRVIKEGKLIKYVRPITDIVLLLSE